MLHYVSFSHQPEWSEHFASKVSYNAKAKLCADCFFETLLIKHQENRSRDLTKQQHLETRQSSLLNNKSPQLFFFLK